MYEVVCLKGKRFHHFRDLPLLQSYWNTITTHWSTLVNMVSKTSLWGFLRMRCNASDKFVGSCPYFFPGTSPWISVEFCWSRAKENTLTCVVIERTSESKPEDITWGWHQMTEMPDGSCNVSSVPISNEYTFCLSFILKEHSKNVWNLT